MMMSEDGFIGSLSKIGSKVVDDSVVMEFCITHISTNQPHQDLLDSYDKAFLENFSSFFNQPTWSTIKFNTDTALNLTFDTMNCKAVLKEIKVTLKETEDLLSFKYDLLFIKSPNKEFDTAFATYLKHKDLTNDGKKVMSQYDILLSVN